MQDLSGSSHSDEPSPQKHKSIPPSNPKHAVLLLRSFVLAPGMTQHAAIVTLYHFKGASSLATQRKVALHHLLDSVSSFGEPQHLFKTKFKGCQRSKPKLPYRSCLRRFDFSPEPDDEPRSFVLFRAPMTEWQSPSKQQYVVDVQISTLRFELDFGSVPIVDGCGKASIWRVGGRTQMFVESNLNLVTNDLHARLHVILSWACKPHNTEPFSQHIPTPNNRSCEGYFLNNLVVQGNCLFLFVKV